MFGNEGNSGSGKKLSPVQKEAMMKVCQEIMGEMDSIVDEGLDAKKASKVTVMADSKKGLEQGLDKAEEVIEGEEGLELDSLDSEDDSALSEQEIDEKIKELMALKAQKQVKAPF